MCFFLSEGCSVTVFDLRKGFSDDRVKFIEGNLVKKVRLEFRVGLVSPSVDGRVVGGRMICWLLAKEWT
jgi:hypothetical protein